MIIHVTNAKSLAKQVTLQEAEKIYEPTREYLRIELDYVDRTNIDNLIGTGFVIHLKSEDDWNEDLLIFPKPVSY